MEAPRRNAAPALVRATVGPMALQPLLVGEILDSGVRLFRRHFGVFVRIVAPVALVYSAIALVVRLASAPSDDFAARFDGNRQYRAASVLVSIAGLLVFTVIGAACVHAAGESILGRTPTAGSALKAGLRRAVPVLALGVLWAAMLGLLAFTLLGWIVPLVGCSVAVPVCVFERVGPLKSIRRSWRMSFRRFMPTLAVIVSGGMMVALLVYFGAIFTVISFASNLSRRGYVISSIVSSVATLVTALAFVPLVAAWQVVTYTDFRVRQEGLDLAVAIDGLGAPAPSAAFVSSSAATGPAPSPWNAESNRAASTDVRGDDPTEVVAAGPDLRPPWER